MKGSKREQRRLEAAEHVCRAFRKAISYYATQGHYMNIAIGWLILWIDNAPKGVQNIPVRKKPGRGKP